MESKTNLQYKDRLFRFIFGAEERKGNLLSLYNALNGSDYSDIDGLEIATIEDFIYMGFSSSQLPIGLRLRLDLLDWPCMGAMS